MTTDSTPTICQWLCALIAATVAAGAAAQNAPPAAHENVGRDAAAETSREQPAVQDSANGQRAARDGSVADATRPIPGVDGLSDALVAGAIESELWEARAVDANDIDVDVVQGVVTLTGTVDDILARERAVRIASLTRGVASVIDRFTVAESGRSDATDLMWNDDVAPGEVHRVGSMCRTTPVLPNGVAVAFAST